MRVTVLAFGSRGDVQPYVALGVGLRQAGHSACIAAPALFRDFVECHGLDFYPYSADPQELVALAVEKAPGRPGLFQSGRVLLEFALPVATRIIAESQAACRGADLILHTLFTGMLGHQIALEQDVPDAGALVFPVYARTSSFPNMAFPDLGPGWYNRWTHAFFNQAAWIGQRLSYAWVRRQNPGLPRLTGWPYDPRGPRPAPLIYGISPLLLPPLGQTPEQAHLTGFWYLDTATGWTPPPALEEFLSRGAPPVFIGFGSMIAQDAPRLARLAVEALAQTGQRGILLTGWGGLAARDLPPSVHLLDSAPFDWLFPRVSAAVIHGGTGTTAIAIRCGKPVVVVPFIADQSLWGERAYKLGVAPRPVPYRSLTADRLAGSIRAVLEEPGMRARAAELGACLRSETGVANAVQIIENLAGGR